ncbi:MAG: SDR family oxidoreductase [Deltaproteobacteria bacterium]
MRVFITGISRGLGRAIAEACLNAGHDVWGISRSAPMGLDQRIRHTRCDLCSEKNIKDAYSEVKKAGFAPDIIVLNAAPIKDDFSDAIDLKIFEESFNAGVLGNFRFLNLFLVDIIAAKKAAVFLNISSISSFRAILRRKIAYPAAKAAIDKAFESLRLQSSAKGVKFVTINLGPLSGLKKTPFLTATYADAATKVLRLAEKKGGLIPRSSFCYPLVPSFLYKLAGLIPDAVLKKLLQAL